MTAITNRAWNKGGRGAEGRGDHTEGSVVRGARRLLVSLRGEGRGSVVTGRGRSTHGQLGQRDEAVLGRHLGARI